MKNEAAVTHSTEAKKPGDRRRTMLRRQRIAAIVLAAVIVALSVSLAVANRLVGVYSLKDTFRNEVGEEQTVKYIIKKDKSTGLYALYNKKGEKMAVVEDNGFNNYTSVSDGVQYLVYETDVSGNQYRINTATGEYEAYAVVDTEGDEQLGGTVTSTRIMMYPRIQQADTYSVEVSNQYGNWSIYRKTVETTAENGTTSYASAVTVAVNGVDTLASYDPTLYASLCVSCGYSLTTQKLDLSDPAAPRDANGNVDYAVYGLTTVTDEHGTVDYTKSPAKFTITKGQAAVNGSFVPTDTVYTVYVGSPIVSGNGYYVKRADRDAVYIVSATIADTVLKPAEALVTPQAVYPMSLTTYSMVQQFSFSEVDYDPEQKKILSEKPITAFSFVSNDARENTLYSIVPYWVPQDSETQLLRGYELGNNVDTALSLLYSMKFLSCVKLSPTADDLKAYHLDGNVHALSFLYPDIASGGSGKNIPNFIFISQKQVNDPAFGQDVYYIYSVPYGMIVAVDPYYVSFVEWEQSAWYNPSFFQNNLAYLRELHFSVYGSQYDFILDNSASDQSEGPSSKNLKVICPQYTGSADHVLDYTLQVEEKTDKGTSKITTYTALKNFGNFYERLLWCTIEGDVNAAEFKDSTGMTVEEFIASDTADNKAVAKISYRVEDYAAIANTAKDSDGNPLYTENNKCDVVIRFYEYGASGRKLFLTIEVVDEHAADGTPIPNATKAQGNFYVLASPLADIRNYAQDLLNGIYIPKV